MASQSNSRRILRAYGSFLCKRCASASTKLDMLNYTMRAGHYACLAALVQSGIDEKYKLWVDKALITAADMSQGKCVEILIAAGADVNYHDTHGWTALMAAVRNGHNECVEILIKSGAHVNTRTIYGNTALVLAARQDRHKCIETLIKAGADMNSRNCEGYTAVMEAAKRDHHKCVAILVFAGADVNMQSRRGITASRYVRGEKTRTLLFAAGEKEVMKRCTELYSELRLSHLCRASIRNHLLQMSNMNLFSRVPKLGLPKPLEKYLLFSEILDEDDAAFLSSLLP